VKAYMKPGKTDAADAEAIAEGVTRPIMRFVAVKSKAQQAVLMFTRPATCGVAENNADLCAARPPGT